MKGMQGSRVLPGPVHTSAPPQAQGPCMVHRTSGLNPHRSPGAANIVVQEAPPAEVPAHLVLTLTLTLVPTRTLPLGMTLSLPST